MQIADKSTQAYFEAKNKLLDYDLEKTSMEKTAGGKFNLVKFLKGSQLDETMAAATQHFNIVKHNLHASTGSANSTMRHGRVPIFHAGNNLAFAEEIGTTIGAVHRNLDDAERGSHSIRKSFAFWGDKHKKQPLKILKDSATLLRKDLKGVHPRLEGVTAFDSIEIAAYQEAKTALAKHAYRADVREYAAKLAKEPELFAEQVKSVTRQMKAGQEPKILIHGKDGHKSFPLRVQLPYHTQNGAMSIQIKKPLGFDGRTGYLEAVNDLKQAASKAQIEEQAARVNLTKIEKEILNFNGPTNKAPSTRKATQELQKATSKLEAANKDVELSKEFDTQFHEKLMSMTTSGGKSTRDQLRFTLDDLDTPSRISAYLRRNPHMDKDLVVNGGKDLYIQGMGASGTQPYSFKEIADEVVSAVSKDGDTRIQLRNKLSEIAADPKKSFFMDAMPFERVTPDDMKYLAEEILTVPTQITTERGRLATDAIGGTALGLLGLATGKIVWDATSGKAKLRERAEQDRRNFRSNLLQNKVKRLQY